MPENRGCGCGFGFGDDCIWIFIILILICCGCGGNRGFCKKNKKKEIDWKWRINSLFQPVLSNLSIS